MTARNFLLDSDVLIWILRKKEKTLELVREIKEEGGLGCSTLSILEIQAGAKPGEEEKTNLLLESLRAYPLKRENANLAGKFLREYQLKGITLDFVDAAIAATAILNDLVLVTYNLKHYPMPAIKLYESA